MQLLRQNQIRCETNLYWFPLCNRLRMATKRNIKYIVGQHEFRKHMTICNCSSEIIFKLKRIRQLAYLICNGEPFICVYFSFMDLIEYIWLSILMDDSVFEYKLEIFIVHRSKFVDLCNVFIKCVKLNTII